MSTNEILKDSIHKQFEANKRINLFYENLDFRTHFLQETKEIIEKHKWDILRINEENESEKWVGMMTERALQTFCNNNQYIDLRKDHVSDLQLIYQVLWNDIVEELKTENIDFELLQKSHLTRLSSWLLQTNGFVKEINDPQSPNTIDVTCSEYTAEFQIKLLNINIEHIIEPVLDIGCGSNALLVNHLRELGIQAYGMDRIITNSDEYTFRTNWLDFEFKPYYWGTIISNLSFALHFTNHHNRKDGDYIFYARKYMEILNSLKKYGTFYYAPGLPFIEAHLPKEKFKTLTHRISPEFSYTQINCL